ncbi:MAG: hypothetical protein M3N08_06675, partial [Pseudomonadota bacterium]|nr:hypothetical protein [Pseudomonadota bacterium]
HRRPPPLWPPVYCDRARAEGRTPRMQRRAGLAGHERVKGIAQLWPEAGATTIGAIASAARSAAAGHLPAGADEVKAYLARLSHCLLMDKRANGIPELQALGFWLRRAAVESMLKRYLAGFAAGPISGIVFQLPPSNVPTLFGYTAAIALLCGEVSVIRLSNAENSVQALLVTLIKETLKDASASVRNRLFLLKYDHDDNVTEALSSLCSLRLVWGSDETVRHIAGLALPSTARHISFGDRFSAMALKASAYQALDGDGREAVVRDAFNDIYMFDQLACASPRLIIWVGTAEVTAESGEEFYTRLSDQANLRRYEPDIGGRLVKLNTSYLALHDLRPVTYAVYGPSLSVIALGNLKGLSGFKAVNYGYGTLLASRLVRLADLAEDTEPRDQTLACWGFDSDEIDGFVRAPRRSGFDRIVPLGQALTFDPVWDGCNLFEAMTRIKDKS